MVYCTKCGAKNEDGAEVCVDCGERLYPTRTKYQRSSRRQEDMCFGPRAGSYWGIFIGVIIILWGLSMLLNIEAGPLIIIALGILILISVLARKR